MNETQIVDSGPRLPKQIVAQHAHAISLQESGTEPPAPSPPAAPAAPTTPLTAAEFTPEALLNAPDASRDNDPKYWKARANVIEGHRRVDMAKLNQKVVAQQEEIDRLKAELAKPRNNAPAPAADDAIDLTQHFSADVLDRIGEDNALAIVKAAKQIADSTVEQQINAAVKPYLDKEKAKVEDEAAERHRKFVTALDEGEPNWRIINKDVRWLKYLDGVDPSTGFTRQQIVDKHSADKNAMGILTMIRAFMSGLAPVEVPSTPPATPPALPGTGSDGPPPPGGAPTDGVFLTEQQIRDGYKAKSLGKMTKEQAREFDARVAATMARRAP